MQINNKIDFSEIVNYLLNNTESATKTARMELFRDYYNEIVSLTRSNVIFGNAIVESKYYKQIDQIIKNTVFYCVTKAEEDLKRTSLLAGEDRKIYRMDFAPNNIPKLLKFITDKGIAVQIKPFENQLIAFDNLLQDSRGFVGNLAFYKLNPNFNLKTINEIELELDQEFNKKANRKQFKNVFNLLKKDLLNNFYIIIAEVGDCTYFYKANQEGFNTLTLLMVKEIRLKLEETQSLIKQLHSSIDEYQTHIDYLKDNLSEEFEFQSIEKIPYKKQWKKDFLPGESWDGSNITTA